MKQGTANLAEDYCFIHKALRPVSKARRKIAAVPPSNSRPALTPVTQVAPLRSECLLDPDARQRGVDANAKSAGNAFNSRQHHREVVSRGGHQAFVSPSDGCADAEASLAGPYPADACRLPIAPWGVGAGSTNWTALSTWQPLDGHAPPPRRTSPGSHRGWARDNRSSYRKALQLQVILKRIILFASLTCV